MTARKSGTIQRFTLDPNNLPTLTPEEEAALDAAPIDYSDIPELPDSFWETPQPKEPVTIRLDRDILDFFRAEGARGYQTRINAVLRAFVVASRKAPAKGSTRREHVKVLIAGRQPSKRTEAKPSPKKAEA